MKRNLLIASLLLSGAASAQFTQANEPAIGAAQPMYEVDQSADSYSTLTGSGQTWDYSMYGKLDNSPRTFSVVDPATTPEGATFTAADKAIVIEGFMTTYISSTSTERVSQGFVYIDGTDTTVVDLSANDELLMNYPMALNNSLVDTYSGTANTTILPTPLNVNGNDMAIVDGSGTLILNSTTSLTNVLRYKLVDTATAVTMLGNVELIRMQYEYYNLGSNSNLPVFVHSTISMSIAGGTPTVTSIVLSSAEPDGFVNTNENTLTGVTVSPNPANDVLSVKGLKNSGTLTLVDAQGKTIAVQAVEAGIATMNIDHVNAGVYFLHIASNNETSVQRVVIR